MFKVEVWGTLAHIKSYYCSSIHSCDVEVEIPIGTYTSTLMLRGRGRKTYCLSWASWMSSKYVYWLSFWSVIKNR